MSSHLSKDLKNKYDVRAIPVRKGDLVKILRGDFKGREGKVETVYRRRRCIYIEKIVKEKTNGQQAKIPIHPSNVTITTLKLDKDRKAILEKKKRTAASKDKHKQSKKMDWAQLSSIMTLFSHPIWVAALALLEDERLGKQGAKLIQTVWESCVLLQQ